MSRRSSHVGHISLGDTAVPGLSTMPLDPKQERESRRRVRALSKSDSDYNRNNKDTKESSSSTDSAVTTGLDSSNNLINKRNTISENDQNGNFKSSSSSISSSSSKRSSKSIGKLTPLSKFYYSYLEYSYRNSWLNPLICLLVIFTVCFLSPDKSPNGWTHMFIHLSYEIPKEQLPISDVLSPETAPFGVFPMYGKGLRDFAFVFTGTIFFMFFREFVMQVLLNPLAKVCGLKRKSKISRFMEQTYAIVYFGMSAPLGLYVMYITKDIEGNPLWYFETVAFYANYPHKIHGWLFKAFYLLQASFWTQQSVVLCLQLEKPRRDFKELVFHHVVTIALIFCSYRFHFAFIGIAVFITMDFSDIFLSLSKTLNYLDSKFTPVMFIIFIGVWVYARHYLNLWILWSVLTEFRTIGPYTLSFADEQYKCWISQVITFVLIFSLQLVNLYWLFLILRILYRLVTAGEQKDERSDDEDEDEDEENDENLTTTSNESDEK